ncbi:MAG: 2-hydroxychromene-2-carboxylate isomerase [Deltaproteobacteria bacterium]|nr:2-hydroxychromene-2-carboxylate isomerase [Deltaproteobacteria bacterium]
MASCDFLFDYASPWAYLADILRTRLLPGVTVQLQPIYLRGLSSFSTGIPYSPAKLQYIMQDLGRCAAHHAIPIRPPSHFPVNGLYALRGALWCQQHAVAAAPAFHAAAFAAAWRDDRNVSDRAVVLELAHEVGLDRDAFSAGLDDPAIKDALKTRTAAAAERGVFGVPSFFVGSQLFWGHDRLDYVARALAAL